jgi:glutathione synthase/RimK-type ligase-like ATP-grasp enzyme
MGNLIIVDNPSEWPLEIATAEVVAARAYLVDSRFSALRRARVYNLCKSYRYQSNGYYVSLLAAARGHRPLPDVLTIQDMKNRLMLRPADELDELIARSLADILTDRFELSVYFGRNLAQRHARLSRALFNLFPVPLLRASFQRRQKQWRLTGLKPIPLGDIPASHREFLRETIENHFSQRMPARTAPASRFQLAMLVDPEESSPPSDAGAIRRFAKAAAGQGFDVEIIGPDDYGRIAEFDALFIRETTRVNHRSFRFASRARAEGLVVIDDPESILRCANKVYLAELMARLKVSTPPTMIVHRDNASRVGEELGFPCVLKQPDSAFSHGVVKADDPEALRAELERMLTGSDLVVAQAYVPTAFDWRVGVLDRRVLFVCRYYMARHHWQIYKHGPVRTIAGRWDTLAVADAPAAVVELGLRAANAIGDGFYGVDIKELDSGCVVIEVNDNPSVESGVEDQVLGDSLYEEVMRVFRARVEAGRAYGNPA